MYGILTVLSQAMSGGTAAITIYGTGGTATYVGGFSDLWSAINGCITGYKCTSRKDAFKCGAYSGYEQGQQFANTWLDAAK